MDRRGVFERMRADHRHVLQELALLEKAAHPNRPRSSLQPWPGDGVIQVLEMLSRQFETHMAAEDEFLFPALVEALPHTLVSVEPLRADHATLRAMLHSLQKALSTPRSESRDEQISIQLRDFVDLLRIHIRKEEAVAISVAERVLRPAELKAFAAHMESALPGKRPKGSGPNPRKGDRS